MKIKCSQCGCTDLVNTCWPHEYILNQIAPGIAGETSLYEMDEVKHADVYICTKCGHYEFFNKKLADQILEHRNKLAEISNKISETNKIIDSLSRQNIDCENKILICNMELKNLDITVIRSNEIKENIKSLQNEIKEIKKKICQNQTKRNKLQNKLQNLE